MSQSDDEVLVRVEGVSKKFCRSLKKSLWYGVCDIAGELLPGRKRQRVAGSELRVAGEEAEVTSNELRVTGENTSAVGENTRHSPSYSSQRRRRFWTRHSPPVTRYSADRRFCTRHQLPATRYYRSFASGRRVLRRQRCLV
jgi:hypothetical protein